MKLLVIYDDTGRKSEVITDIIGEKGFSEVVVKRRRLEDYYKASLEKLYPDLSFKKISSVFEYSELLKELDSLYQENTRVLHCFSNYIISDEESALLSFKKIDYIDEAFGVMDGKKAAAAVFPSLTAYKAFCKNIIAGQKAWDLAKQISESFEIEGLVDIGIIGNFIQCITGNFDSRYFNSLEGNEYTLVKSSTNKKKIKAEYSFYHLLPDDMKIWFVMPFDYQESETEASYTMERLHMTDLAIKWVHSSMGEEEFEELMDKYFYFFRCRHKKECDEAEYKKAADSLYVDKVNERISKLKTLPEFEPIKKMLEAANGMTIDDLVQKYFSLKQAIESRVQYEPISVIGHGDPCFANAMYNKSTKTLKFIDPKGAMTESELWTNPYYDVAKLSHSVCGLYDFFNNAIYDIKVESDFAYNLEIPFANKKYLEIFKRKCEENDFDYLSVRIYEASLFLSMLPLHIDNPHKVFGFILNAKNILEEIEADV